MRTLIQIPGMHCPSCVALVKDVSRDFPSIQHIDVDLGTKNVTLQHDGHFDLPAWSKAIEELNDDYRVQTLSQRL